MEQKSSDECKDAKLGVISHVNVANGILSREADGKFDVEITNRRSDVHV
jgi:hypothetical protein